MSCDAFDDAVTELALGHLSEPQRSALLAHAGTCARCAAELADVVTVTDGLLELAPEVEPPVGFEQRVAAPPSRSRSSRPRARWLVTAAAALAAVALVGSVALSGDPASTVDATVLAADGNPAGTIELGADELVLVLAGDADWPGTWSCELLTGGRWVEVGTWTADDVVDRTWSVSIEPGIAGDATAMRVRSARGDVLYTAALG